MTELAQTFGKILADKLAAAEHELAEARAAEIRDIADAKEIGLALGKDYWHRRHRAQERLRVLRGAAAAVAEVAR